MGSLRVGCVYGLRFVQIYGGESWMLRCGFIATACCWSGLED